MTKLAVFYMIGQFGNPRWKEDFFDDQMNLLKTSGLYDNIEHIDIFVKSNTNTKDMSYISMSDLPGKTNNLTYLGDLEEETPHNRKMYRAYNQIMQRMWLFSQANPDYKLLFFHSLGLSHNDPIIIERKYKWRKYMETLVVNNWRQSVDLLNFYDCVGTEYIQTATFDGGRIQFTAPHYQGYFWWANANYIAKLNPLYFYQTVEWQPYLCELWIGSGNPKAYNYYNSWLNQYFHDNLNPPFQEIIMNTERHLMELKNDL
jgi:hypothetical protein